jgi:hypothetical protein
VNSLSMKVKRSHYFVRFTTDIVTRTATASSSSQIRVYPMRHSSSSLTHAFGWQQESFPGSKDIGSMRDLCRYACSQSLAPALRVMPLNCTHLHLYRISVQRPLTMAVLPIPGFPQMYKLPGFLARTVASKKSFKAFFSL